MRLLCPWTIAEYPGWIRALATLCNVRPRTAERWLYPPHALPRRHALTLARVAEEHAAKAAALAEALRAHAAAIDEQIEQSGLEKVRRRGG